MDIESRLVLLCKLSQDPTHYTYARTYDNCNRVHRGGCLFEVGAYSNKFGKHSVHLFCVCLFYGEATHMISGVNVGASVGKDKKTVGEAKRAKVNITML